MYIRNTFDFLLITVLEAEKIYYLWVPDLVYYNNNS